MEDILKNITAPDLTTADYGKAINEQFSNIDENFKKIANHEFLKGDKGDSLKIKNIKIVENDELHNALLSAIKNEFESKTSEKNTESSEETLSWLDSVNGYNWDDSLKELSIPMIYSVDSITKVETYICSVGIVSFFDNRFSANSIKNASDLSVFENKIDTTCLISFDRDGENDWVCNINKSFPRLTYKNNSFYWVINNNDTIIKATGIKGDTGNNAVLHIGKIKVNNGKIRGEELCEITALFIENDWVAIDEVEKYGYNINANDPIIVYILDEDTELNSYFIGNVVEDSDSYKVKYIEGNNVTSIDFSLQSKELFRSIGKQNVSSENDPARGIFLLMNQFKRNEDSTITKQDSSIGEAYAHMIYNEKQDLYILPVSNYNETNPQIIESGSIGVGKPALKIGDYNTIIRSGKGSKPDYDSSPIGIEDPKLFFDSIDNISNGQPSDRVWYFNTVDVNTDGIKIYSSKIQNAENESKGLTVSISNGVYIDSQTTISGKVGITGDTTISGAVDITGDTTISGAVDITGDTTISGKVGITGDTTISGKIGITGDTTIKGEVGIKGATIIKNNNGSEVFKVLKSEANLMDSSILKSSVVINGIQVEKTQLEGIQGVKGVNSAYSSTQEGEAQSQNELNKIAIPGLIVRGYYKTDISTGQPISSYCKALEVYGDTTISGKVGVFGDTTINGKLTINNGVIGTLLYYNIGSNSVSGENSDITREGETNSYYLNKPYSYINIEKDATINGNSFSLYFNKDVYADNSVVMVFNKSSNNIIDKSKSDNNTYGKETHIFALDHDGSTNGEIRVQKLN